MKVTAELVTSVQTKWEQISDCLNEKGRRLWCAAEALSYGHGGLKLVHQATGICRPTIRKGIREIENPTESPRSKRIRKVGAGRKKISDSQSEILSQLIELIEPTTRGDPESHLQWTCKSTRHLADDLNKKGYKICYKTVGNLLHELGYSLQANKKTLEGNSHKDRNAQFEYLNKDVDKFVKAGQPIISVDGKKKENIGNYKNNGREWSQQGRPIEVKGHDFPDKKLGKVTPYGVYDIGRNEGWVSVGISADTAEFAVNSIRTWWYKMGSSRYPNAKELLITADCGGSNGYRVRLWKYELQKFANETGLKLCVRHFPPGTSKWNKIEHRLFSYISMNWRGKPLISRELVVNLIANTTTSEGLVVQAVLDENEYEKGRKVSDEEFAALKIEGKEFHPEWNYSIGPHS